MKPILCIVVKGKLVIVDGYHRYLAALKKGGNPCH